MDLSMYVFILSFQLHNKTVCNLTLQSLKLQELCDNSIGWKYSYYMLNNKEPVGLIFNSKDKKNISKAFFPGNKTTWG